MLWYSIVNWYYTTLRKCYCNTMCYICNYNNIYIFMCPWKFSMNCSERMTLLILWTNSVVRFQFLCDCPMMSGKVEGSFQKVNKFSMQPSVWVACNKTKEITCSVRVFSLQTVILCWLFVTLINFFVCMSRVFLIIQCILYSENC